MLLPNTRITELHPLLLDDLAHGVVVDVLLEAVLDVELLGEDRKAGLVSQHVRYGEVRLAVLTKLRPVLADLVGVVENISKQTIIIIIIIIITAVVPTCPPAWLQPGL